MKAFFMASVATAVMALSQPVAAQQLEPVKVSLGYTADGTYTAIIAMADRFAKPNGLDVTIVVPGGTADAIKLLASNTVQFATPNSMTDIQAVDRGIPVVSLNAPGQGCPFGILTTPESGIHSVKDLEGKTIGVTGIPVLRAMLLTVLRANGGDVSKVKVIEVGFGGVPLLLAGKIDAMGDALDPVEAMDFNAARQKPLGDDSAHVFLPYSKNGGPNCYMFPTATTQDYLAAHGDTARKILKALKEANEWAMKNPDEAVKIIVKRYPEVKYDVTLAQWKANIKYLRSADTDAHGFGWQNPEVWSKLVAFMHDNKLIQNPVDASKVFTNDYLPK